MGCIYNSWCDGCTMHEKGTEPIDLGCDVNGNCMVEEDECPSDSCYAYQGDYTCSDCGADLYHEDCTCDE